MVSDATSQVTLQKHPRVKFWCNIREEYLQLAEKALKISLLFLTLCLMWGQMSSHISTKTTCRNRQNAGAGVRVQLSSTKPDIKEIYKRIIPFISPIFLNFRK